MTCAARPRISTACGAAPGEGLSERMKPARATRPFSARSAGLGEAARNPAARRRTLDQAIVPNVSPNSLTPSRAAAAQPSPRSSPTLLAWLSITACADSSSVSASVCLPMCAATRATASSSSRDASRMNMVFAATSPALRQTGSADTRSIPAYMAPYKSLRACHSAPRP